MNNLGDSSHSGHIEGLQLLTDLIKDGYTSQGINFGCGCDASRWFKDRQIISTHFTFCEAHNREVKLSPSVHLWKV